MGSSFIVDIMFLFCRQSSRLSRELFMLYEGISKSSLHLNTASNSSFLASGCALSSLLIDLSTSPIVFLT
jgi:hypothetical protein